MNLLSIVGARPQFVKLAPLSRAIERYNSASQEPIAEAIVHTGQHYDTNMSDVFFKQLDIPQADINLNVGSGTHGEQIARMLKGIEQVLLARAPDMVVTYGDTNSTVAGALAAANLNIPTTHVEAGLRSFNRRMPEEINRIVADHVSDLLLAPTATGLANLQNEGLQERAVLTGDIMHDALLFNLEVARRESTILDRLMLDVGHYGLVTVHRAENTNNTVHLRNLLLALNDIVENGLRLVFPVHPRTAQFIAHTIPGWKPGAQLQIVEPVAYLDMLCMLDNAQVTLTDSGGLQKEAFFLGCPCVTLRNETEWIETVQGGGNILVGDDPAKIVAAVNFWKQRFPQGHADFSSEAANAFGGGDAANKILQAILDFNGKLRSMQ
jgi:UDP-N-acetylglucosamine 2-epimerase